MVRKESMEREWIDEVKRHFNIVAESLEKKIDIVAEGHSLLNNKIEAFREEIFREIQRFRIENELAHNLIRKENEAEHNEIRKEIQDLRKENEAEHNEMRRENKAEHEEIRSLIKFSYSEIEKHVVGIESELETLRERVSYLETSMGG